jgi:hypothetical protein
MQYLNLSDDSDAATEERKPFWRRQFQTEATKSQKTFDWIFGVILPTICAAADPAVFKDDLFGGGALLGQYKPFAYLLSFGAIMAMSAWLLWGKRLGGLNAFLSGLFLMGSIISLFVGIILLPFSLLGLIFLIGALGFTPLLSSVVFARNAFRALSAANASIDPDVAYRAFIMSAMMSFCVPFAINGQINNIISDVLSADAATARHEGAKLKLVWPIVNADAIAIKYHRSSDEEIGASSRQTLAEIYKGITGENIENHCVGFD